MPSFLGEYTVNSNKCATNREFKLQRAIDSFLFQKYQNSELIIISDGCDQTVNIVNKNYAFFIETGKIKIFKIPKKIHFSGAVRAEGLKMATGDLICYLDSDDILGPYHLEVMGLYYDKSMDWMYYDDFIYDGDIKTLREVTPKFGKIGTSSFCHLSTTIVNWQDGYGHDWATIQKLFNYKYKKMNTPEYLVCHMSAINLDF